MEKPNSSRSTSSPQDIRCPQCKSEIQLSRPRNVIAELVAPLERVWNKVLFPGVVCGLGYIVVASCSWHGAYTIRTMFGPDDAFAILAPRTPAKFWDALERQLPVLAQSRSLRLWRGFRVELGLPIIPIALMASRTSIADAVLPFFPVLFLATHPRAYQVGKHSTLSISSQEYADLNHWPPSAAFTVIMLPYIRGLYNEYVERAWGEHERRWLKEVQPRFGQSGTQDHVDGRQPEDNNDDEVVEVEVDFGVAEDEGNENDANEPMAQPNVPGVQAPALNQPPADGDLPRANNHQQDANPRQAEAQLNELADRVQALAAEQRELQQQNQQDQHRNGDNHILISGTRIADTVVGALLFPSVSALMGETLKWILPAPWTSGVVSKSPGLLQTKWGRSIVGGCLFVVLKDAIRIYCRWWMAQAFRKRRVLNWDQQAGKPVS